MTRKMYPLRPTSHINSIVDDIFDVFFDTNNRFFSSQFFDDHHFDLDSLHIPSYPVSNFYILDDGTSVLEVACTGFSKNGINLSIENNKLVIEGKKEKEEELKRKVIYEKIATRDFKMSYAASRKWDLNSISSKFENGLLTITIPLKEEEKPVTKQIPIK